MELKDVIVNGKSSWTIGERYHRHVPCNVDKIACWLESHYKEEFIEEGKQMDYEVREFDEEGELYFVTHFGGYEQDAWEYAESLARKGIYAEVHTQSTYEGCNM